VKILVQNNVFYPNVIGGAEMSSWLLAVELTRRGWEVDAMATTGRHGRGTEITTRPIPQCDGVVYEAPGTGLVDLYVRRPRTSSFAESTTSRRSAPCAGSSSPPRSSRGPGQICCTPIRSSG
jgi:hypothetical protein